MITQTHKPTNGDLHEILVDMQQTLAHIVEHGATKEDLLDVKKEFRQEMSDMKSELKDEIAALAFRLT